MLWLTQRLSPQITPCKLPSLATVGAAATLLDTVHSWKMMDQHAFSEAVSATQLGSPPSDINVTELFDLYYNVLTDLAHKFAAPQIIKRRKQLLTPWYDSDCRASRREYRALDSHYRRTNDPVDRNEWVQEIRGKHEALHG